MPKIHIITIHHDGTCTPEAAHVKRGHSIIWHSDECNWSIEFGQNHSPLAHERYSGKLGTNVDGGLIRQDALESHTYAYGVSTVTSFGAASADPQIIVDKSR